MKKQIIFLVLALMGLTVMAKPVEPATAVQVARHFALTQLNAKQRAFLGDEPFADATVVYAHPMPESGRPAMYVVNLGSAFVIVAADDVAHPILGYNMGRPWPTASNDGGKSNNRAITQSSNLSLPSQVSGFLDDLANQINAALQQNVAPDRGTASEWQQLGGEMPMYSSSNIPDSVGPLLTTTWDQGQYYNALCPEDTNGPADHAYTGCVATAMAQIINYWGYPVHGRGTHSYESTYGTLVVNYDSATYDYADMPSVLTATSTSAQVNAVAKLMHNCGVAANMQYGSTESSSYDIDARAGMINFFRISPDASYAEKAYFSDTDWNNLLQTNLSSNQPVMYSGHGTGGHTFVCDGYNANDYYHFNFGWSGYADGWYMTNSVTPAGSNYNSNQSAILGIAPDSTGNVILGQMAGTSTFIVNEPLEFYHLLGHNAYTCIGYANPCNNTVVFASQDTTKQLILDILTFDEQTVTVFDSIMGEFLSSLSVGVFDPIIVSGHLMTLSYQGNFSQSGFRLKVSQDNGCRRVSNVSATVNANTINLSWSDNSNATQWQVEYGLHGFNMGDGTQITVSDTAVSISDLTKFKEYDFYVRPLCSSGLTAEWSNVVTIMTEAPYWTDIVTTKPDGYVEDSLGNIYISSAEGLAWFSRLSQSSDLNHKSFTNRKTFLTADVNLGQYKWKPVKYYNGIFDGQGYTIDSMFCILDWADCGLFGWIIHGTVKNVNIHDCYVVGTTVGGVAGRISGDTIMNCMVSGTLKGLGSIMGGIVGDADENATICIVNSSSNCLYIDQSQNSFFHIGGIAGKGPTARVGNLVIRNCYASGFIRKRSHSTLWDGGILSYGEYTTIENCYANHTINANKLYTLRYSEALDNDWFSNTDSGYYIDNPILFDPDSVSYTKLIEVMNAGVRKYNIDGLRLWIEDTAFVNDGLPLLGSYYETPCRNISGLQAKNITDNNGDYAVKLSWRERGDATMWEVRYSLENSNAEMRYLTTSNPDTISGLTEHSNYYFRVRPVCAANERGGWSDPISHIFDIPYWTEVVTSQPAGYDIDTDGNVTISTAEGLAWLISTVNGMNGQTANPFVGKSISLTQNVNIGRYKWTPINRFRGTFDGENHTISNLYVNETTDLMGFFGDVCGGIYQNIRIDSAFVHGGQYYTGILIGRASIPTVVNCHVSGTVQGGHRVGGLIGKTDIIVSIRESLYVSYGSIVIDACSSSGLVQGYGDGIGGLVGNGRGTIRNSFSNSNVLGNSYDTGGLVGGGDPIIMNSYATGNVSGQRYTGGITGSIVGSYSSIKNCYKAGGISGIGYYTGIISGPTQNTPVFSNCFAPNNPSFPMFGVSETDEEPVFSDNTFYTVTTDGIVLQDSVNIGQSSYNDLLSALNAWVDTYDTSGVLLHWRADTSGINGGFPVLEPYVMQYYTVSLSVADSTPYGSVSGGRAYSICESDSVIIYAKADRGYHFEHWNDGNNNNPRLIRLSQDTAFTAVFAKHNYVIVGTTSRRYDYSFDFEDRTDDDQWTITYGNSVNRWCINSINDTNRALFVSRDLGLNNVASDAQSTTFAYTELTLTEGLMSVSYDLRCYEMSNYGYMRLALIPKSDYPGSLWSLNTLPANAINLENFSHNTAYAHTLRHFTKYGSIPADGDYYLVALWHNTRNNSQPVINPYPAYLDNVCISNYSQYSSDEVHNGEVYGSDTVSYLDTVILTAVPYHGYRFVSWHDGNTDNPRTVVAQMDKVYIAKFECIPFNIDVAVACETYTWNGTAYTASGNYTYSHADDNGCTQVDTLHLTINYNTNGDTSAVACDSFTWWNTNYTNTTDTATHTLTNAAGCDSTVTLHLTINNPIHTATTETACETYTWNGTAYPTSGNYTYSHVDADGCTQVDTLHLTVNNPVHTATTEVACETYTWNGTAYTTSGNYTYSHADNNGCTQVDTLHLTIYHNTTGDTTATACDSFIWWNTNYTNSTNTATHTFTNGNAAGCDSTVTLHLTVNNPVHTTATVTACEIYTWNGTAYTSSGNYTYSHADNNGCTQVDTLHLTVNNPVHTTTTETACETYTWNGTAYPTSGNYTYSHFDANGCTQVDTLHLTINNPVHTATTETACETYTWNGTAYTSSGNYTYSHSDANGCTQVDTLHLTINNPVHTATNETACGTYTWNGTAYTASGNYTYSHADDNGCTQVDTLHLTINYNTTGDTTATACDSFTWWNTNYTNSTDNATHTLTNAVGCDSTVTLHLTVNYSVVVYDSLAITSAELPYDYHGNSIDAEGDYTFTDLTAAGCDSTTYLNVTVSQIGIDDVGSAYGIKVYPNPTGGLLTVEGSDLQRIELVDMTGRTVLVGKCDIHAGSCNLDLSTLPQGTYMLRITTVDGVAIRKVVKQ